MSKSRYNSFRCLEGEDSDAGTYIGAIIGSLFVIVAVVAIALVLLLLYR